MLDRYGLPDRVVQVEQTCQRVRTGELIDDHGLLSVVPVPPASVGVGCHPECIGPALHCVVGLACPCRSMDHNEVGLLLGTHAVVEHRDSLQPLVVAEHGRGLFVHELLPLAFFG